MTERDKELSENEEYISSDDVEIEVSVDEEEDAVIVRFTGFDDYEDAEQYAIFLAETLPLLLFETTKIQ